MIDAKSGGSSRACARSDDVAFSRYCTLIALGSNDGWSGPWLPSTCPSPSPRRCTTRSRARSEVVVDEEPFGHGDLGVARLHPHHMRHYRGEIRHSDHRRGREQPAAARAARRGASTCDMSWSGLPCPATLLRSKIASATDRPAKRVSGGQGFGAGPDLGHTVRVASSRVRAWRGIRPAPSGARPVPTSIATDFRRGRACARATHPSAGVGEPQTGKQRRHSCATGFFSACGSRPGPSMGPLVVR